MTSLARTVGQRSFSLEVSWEVICVYYESNRFIAVFLENLELVHYYLWRRFKIRNFSEKRNIVFEIVFSIMLHNLLDIIYFKQLETVLPI